MILDWTWPFVISSIQFILKYLTLLPSSTDSLSSSSTPTFPSFRLRSITADLADSVVCGELLLLDFPSFFPPSVPLVPRPFYVGLLGWSCVIQHNGRIRRNAYGGGSSPLDLWQVRTTVARAISIPGFCRRQRYVPWDTAGH
jgi:hypothetical protein